MTRPKLKESWVNDGGQLPFVESAESLMEYLETDNPNSDRAKFVHFIFESVLEELYGPKVWDWYNERIQ
jgi:hypothetical protein